MNLPDLLAEIGRLGMVLVAGRDKIRWQSQEQPPADLLRALAQHKGELLAYLNAPTSIPTKPTKRLEVEFALEVEELERRHFGGKFPPLLARCVGHFLAGPCLPELEPDPAAWWQDARRQVLRMIAVVLRDPTRYAAWRPPE
jgi:hypothetical protein